MAFGDEDLTELRTQRVAAEDEPCGSSSEPWAGCGAARAAGGSMGWRLAAPGDVPHGGPGFSIPGAVPGAVSPAGSIPRILVVDDNEDAAEMLALVLRKRGFAVVLAFDGEEALVMADAHRPGVVLLDIGLPGIDGYEVARRLRAKASADRPMLVAVTGYGQPADRQRAHDAGFDHHMVKPVAMEKLLPLLDPKPS